MKWLVIVIGVVAVAVGAVVAIGSALPQNHTASRTAHLSAAPDSVWSVIMDVERYPTWRADVSAVEAVRGTPALTWRETTGGDRITYEATASDRPTRFVARIADKGLPFGGSWEYRLQPDGEGTKVTITERGEVYNPLFRFVSRYVMGHTGTIDRYLTALAAKTGDQYVPDAKN
jgi:uncharacterized protein YndB with AHSA1/START domain